MRAAHEPGALGLGVWACTCVRVYVRGARARVCVYVRLCVREGGWENRRVGRENLALDDTTGARDDRSSAGTTVGGEGCLNGVCGV